MSISRLYRYFFKYIIKYVHLYNIKFLLELFYPSLKSIRKKFPKLYFSKISSISINATYLQLKKKDKNLIFDLRKKNHKLYLKILSQIKNNNFTLINKSDENYQNFLDFPILVKNKKSLNNYLLKKGIEVRFKHYYNCQKLFKAGNKCINAERYEKELICLPNHPKISLSYIDSIVKNIEVYHSKI